MDILRRIRIAIWLVLIALWAVTVYQYLGPEPDEDLPRPLPLRRSLTSLFSPPSGPPRPADIPAGIPPDEFLALVKPPPETIGAAPPAESHPSLNAPFEWGGVGRGPAAPPSAGPAPAPAPGPEPQVPPGFAKTELKHFNVYGEGGKAPDWFCSLLETLYANLMIDLSDFTPWTDSQKVSIFFFKTERSYLLVTGRPSWSGGCSSVPDREIYIYNGADVQGILAHELCHIYYDGFFIGGKPDPLWLSEGMATVMQVEKGLAAPLWLGPNLRLIKKGEGMSFPRLMGYDSLEGLPLPKTEIWYTEAYTVVRLLLRLQYRASFYRFSLALKEGKPLGKALFSGYGMPLDSAQNLQLIWRYNMDVRSTTRS